MDCSRLNFISEDRSLVSILLKQPPKNSVCTVEVKVLGCNIINSPYQFYQDVEPTETIVGSFFNLTMLDESVNPTQKERIMSICNQNV